MLLLAVSRLLNDEKYLLILLIEVVSMTAISCFCCVISITYYFVSYFILANYSSRSGTLL
jgi:hypothetical protein